MRGDSYLRVLDHHMLSFWDIRRCNHCNCQSSTRAVRVLDGSQQKADVVKTDYSDSLLMITRLKTRLITQYGLHI